MALGDSGVNSLGPWSGADLAQTARDSVGLGADSDLPREVRFVSGVAKLIKKRRRAAGAYADAARLSVFLLEPTAPSDRVTDARRVPMLNNGLTAVAGRVWFVSEAVVAGTYIELPDADDDRVFKTVTEGLLLGDVPAVVFDPRQLVAEARFYPKGLASSEQYSTLDLGHTPVSLDRILEALELVHVNCLITPEAQVYPGRLWADAAKSWVAEEAEQLIQLSLKAGLSTAFPTCTVRHEQTGTTGRLDLEIEENDVFSPGSVVRHAILELKVLRRYGSTGKAYSDQATLDWILSGVNQAAAYRTERSALEAALCCFDMRRDFTGDTSFEHVRDLAARLEVRLRLWFLFATSAAYRQVYNTNTGSDPSQN